MMQKNAFQIASQGVYKYNMQNSYIYAYLNIMLEELSKKEENYEAVCQHLLEVIMLCMLRNDNLAIVQNSNALLNRECTQIKKLFRCELFRKYYAGYAGVAFPYEQILYGSCLYKIYWDIPDYLSSAKADTGRQVTFGLDHLFDFTDIGYAWFFLTVLFFAGI